MAAAITGFASGSTAEQVEFTLEPTLEPVSAASSSTTTGEVLVPITELTSQPSSPTSSLQVSAVSFVEISASRNRLYFMLLC